MWGSVVNGKPPNRILLANMPKPGQVYSPYYESTSFLHLH
jgi:hypothetical protein